MSAKSKETCPAWRARNKHLNEVYGGSPYYRTASLSTRHNGHLTRAQLATGVRCIQIRGEGRSNFVERVNALIAAAAVKDKASA